jgi:DNA polymerase (family 10)
MVPRSQAAGYLRELALALELLGEEPPVARALRAAARRIRGLPPGEWRRLSAGAPGEHLGLAGEWAAHLDTFAQTTDRSGLDALQLRLPPGLYELLALPGLGPRRVRRLWHDSQIVTLKQLRRAIRRGQLAPLRGFGPGLEARLRAVLARRRRAAARWLLQEGRHIAQRREASWRATRGLERLALAGEARRACETIGELIWVAAAAVPEEVLGRLSMQAGATLAGDPPERVIWTPPEEPRQQVIVVEPERFSARLFLETGAAGHVRGVLARIATRHADRAPGDLGLPESEEALYARAGLPWIPPALREDRGEIAAAAAGKLPATVSAADLRGVFHVHTDWSDGRASITEVAAAARTHGWEYIGIADHSPSAHYAGGLPAERLSAQGDEVRRVAAENPGLRLYHGVECDILPDGSLDYSDAQLAALDYVIASIHNVMTMSRERMTARVVRALRHPAVRIFAHPSGRLLLQRPAYALDWPVVFAAAAEAGVALEFNTTPDRLDLDWRLIRTATAQGVRLAINPDAHHLGALDQVAEGLATAAKGWLTAEQVINTRSARALEEWFDAPQEHPAHPEL